MKIFIITILLGCIATLSFSQTVNYGIKGGFNISALSASPRISSSVLGGFNAGVIADIGFGNFSIEPGVFYTTKGEKEIVVADAYSPPLYGTTRLNYIEIPIDAIYKVNITKGFNFHFGAGPYFAYSPSQSFKFTYGNSQPYEGPVSDDFKKADFGISSIIGFTLLNKILIDANYDYGLVNINADGYKIINTSVSFSVGYLFK